MANTPSLDSLRNARAAASALYDAADAMNPNDPKLQQLWDQEVKATNLYWSAAAKVLQESSTGLDAAKQALDDKTTAINNQLTTLQDVATAVDLATSLVGLAASLAKFFG